CTVVGVPSITTNSSGFGCFMNDNIVDPTEYGIYIHNRTERLSDIWHRKRMGLVYIKARQSALRRAYPDSFDDDNHFGVDESSADPLKAPNPRSAPGSPRIRTSLEGVDTGITFASISIHDRERYLQYSMHGHEDEENVDFQIKAQHKVQMGGDNGRYYKTGNGNGNSNSNSDDRSNGNGASKGYQ
ncbi:hypothetical protein BGZ70_002201, partial [Mortierella alpina]